VSSTLVSRCPECREPLQGFGADLAICPRDNRCFRVLYAREPLPPKPPGSEVLAQAAVAPPADHHPGEVTATDAAAPVWKLRRVGNALLNQIEETGPHSWNEIAAWLRAGEVQATDWIAGPGTAGFVLLDDFLKSHAHELAAFAVVPPAPMDTAGAAPGAPPRATAASARSAIPSGSTCHNHPGVAAARLCTVCRMPICETCLFAFPGGVTLCPVCATSTPKSISRSRKVRLGWSFGLAAWSTLISIWTMIWSAIQEVPDQATAAALGNLAILPLIIGLALGCSALDRRLTNPWTIKAAIAWNGGVLGIWALLVVLGSLM
jgi:hypothetical protein